MTSTLDQIPINTTPPSSSDPYHYLHFDDHLASLKPERKSVQHPEVEALSPSHTSDPLITLPDFSQPSFSSPDPMSGLPPSTKSVLRYPDPTLSSASTPSISASFSSLNEKPLPARTQNRTPHRRTTYQRMDSTPPPPPPPLGSNPKPRSRSTHQFAAGDFIQPTNAFARAWVSVYDSSLIIRWFFFISPLLVLVWIPGIIGLTMEKTHPRFEI